MMGIELSDERVLDERAREESLVEGLPRSAFTEEYLAGFDKRTEVGGMEQLDALSRMEREVFGVSSPRERRSNKRTASAVSECLRAWGVMD
jgi:hypothetical protein